MAKEKIVYDGTNISEFAKSMKASIATITETGNNIVEKENGEISSTRTVAEIAATCECEVEENKETSAENKSADNTAAKSKTTTIEVTEPQRFTTMTSDMLFRQGHLATLINEMFNSLFVDFVDCRIEVSTNGIEKAYADKYRVPAKRHQVGCWLRFRYMTNSEIRAVDGFKDKIVALDHIISKAHNSNNVFEEINKLNIANGNMNAAGGNSGFVVFTNEAKEALSKYAYTPINKIDWSIISHDVRAVTQEAATGRRIENCFMNVYIDLNKLVKDIFNGTEASEGYKQRKGYSYECYYATACAGAEFVVRINRIDTNAIREFANTAGAVVALSPTANTVFDYCMPDQYQQ